MVLTVVENPAMSPIYPPPREDRLLEAPSAKNAQGLFSPQACLFVGNLSTRVPDEKMKGDLESLFRQFGPCHVKTKQDKKKGLPGAFIQFEHVAHADAALQLQNCRLHERLLRIERAKGRRTAILGLCSNANITLCEVQSVLRGRGSLLESRMGPYDLQTQTGPMVCRVTFAYVDDCRDAVKHFQKDEKHYLELVELDGREGRSPPRSRAYQRSFHTRDGNVPYGFYSNRGRRGVHPSYRGGVCGAPKRQHPALYSDFPPPQHEFPVSYGNGREIPFYPSPPSYPPSPAFPSPGYGDAPFIVHGQARLGNPPPTPVYMPPMSNAPFIVSRQPIFTPHVPPWYEQYLLNNGLIGTPSSINSQSSGYFGPPYFPHGYPPTPDHLVLPESIDPGVEKEVDRYQSPETESPEMGASGTSETEIKSGEETESNDPELAKLLERKTPDKAPKLIRVDDSGSDSVKEEDESSKTEARKSFLVPALEPVPELASESGSENAQDTDNSLDSMLASAPGSEDSQEDDDATIQGAHNNTPSYSRSVSDASQSSSYPISHTNGKSVEVAFQPKVSRTVEGYVRREAERLGSDLGESALHEVIEALEAEMASKKREQAKVPCHEMESESESSSTRTRSLSQSCSSQSG